MTDPAVKQAGRDLLPSLIWAGAMIALALAASFAQRQGLIAHDTMLRLVIGSNGLMIAWFGNRAPKMIAPGIHAQRVTRFAGWSLVLSGLAYAALWAFAPIQQAITFGIAVVAGGMIATFLYCLQLRNRARAGG